MVRARSRTLSLLIYSLSLVDIKCSSRTGGGIVAVTETSSL